MAQLSFLTYLRGIYKLNLNKSGKVHNAIIQSIYDCFVMASEDVDQMRLEMCLSTATGYWLDCWGEYFSVYRKSGELDKDYSKRIIDSVIKPKSTIPAVKDNIVDYLNSQYNTNYTSEDIRIVEPWKELAKYSHKGTLSNDARFFSGDYWCHAVMDISVPEDITQGLIDLVNSVKAAGVKVIWSIFNSYDIVSGFNDANDAFAAYQRHIQLQTTRSKSFGFMLSTSSAKLSGNEIGEVNRKYCISGAREIWSMTNSLYQWFAKISDKQTDDSIIITKKDLIGLLDYYTELETVIDRTVADYYVTIGGKSQLGSDNLVHRNYQEDSLDVSNKGSLSTYKKLSGGEASYETIEHITKITDEMLESLELMDSFMSLSFSGRMSTSEGVLFEHLAEHDLFGKILTELKRFKKKNEKYYNSVQPPILIGERAMWLVQRNKNWLWNTPTMTYQDFFELWEPFDDYEEHTINSIIEFEDAYYKGYITFGDKYQPPVVVGKKQHRTTRAPKTWLFSSPVFLNEELEEIYRRQFRYALGKADYPEPKLEDIMYLEEKYNYEGYSISDEVQPAIEVVSTTVT